MRLNNIFFQKNVILRHMHRIGITIILSVLCVIGVQAQNRKGKLGNGVLKRRTNKPLAGWYVGPGISYMYPYLKETNEISNGDTIYRDMVKPKGKIGAYLEAGYFRYFKKRFLIFDYWDAGLSYKWLRSGEVSEQTLTISETEFMLSEGEMKHSFHNLAANFNLSHRYDMKSGDFWVNTFGLNFDYTLASSSKGSLFPGSLTQTGANPYYFQLHYKMGYGIEWNDRLWIVPSLETPLLNILPFQSGSSTTDYLVTRGRPFLLSIRLMFVNDGTPKKCPPVYNPGGVVPDPNK